ncbi:Uu.00g101730.m01.CDS01 [Anthostomella pinea]|uniref:Uu.00g101730.m01.CDS01 n=1 Tax=Anthostomella pinea TaxID=933095 RepID=A0AAI8V856_9PEZI|nr:Uu.00g101730.m01.CDS01 [Anthostomella pinea]
MPVYDAPADDDDDDNDGGGRGGGGGTGGRPRQSYNFAPGYHGLVYRAAVPDWGAGARAQHEEKGEADAEAEAEEEDAATTTAGEKASGSTQGEEDPTSAEGEYVHDNGTDAPHYKLQSMKWGLIPFWTKRNPDYGSMMKTINCRDDSLAQTKGMWSSMKARKRCIVVAQGFYEWLKKDGAREKDKIPHFVRRRDGKLMCLAGLWDVVRYENDDQKLYTYTIITTDSNKQLNFLHDRMPVILDNGSEALRTWLDPKRHEWSRELQSLLKPFEGELEVYPVSKDVGKVGNNSPSFIIPVDSKENKSNIANFFAKGAAAKKGAKREEPVKKEQQPKVEVKNEEGFTTAEDSIQTKKEDSKVSMKKESKGVTVGIKREADDEPTGLEPPKKVPATVKSPSPQKGGRPKISATSNGTKSPAKAKEPGTQEITKFFANSS